MKYYEFLEVDVYETEEGFEVNDIYNTGFFIVAEEFPEFADIITILKREGWLKKRYRYTSQYSYEDFEVVEYQNRPLFQLQETTESMDGQYFTNFSHRRNAIIYKITPKTIRKVQ